MDFQVPDEHQAIRSAVRELCAAYPSAYWRELDRHKGYPTDFVRALTEAGWLGALIPTEFGGAGLGIAEAAIILEEVNRARRQRRPCPRPDVHHGHAAAARLGGPEATLPAADRPRRAAPAGLRRDRARRRLRDHAPQNLRRPTRRLLRGQRPEGVDLARGALRPPAAARAHDAVRGARRQDPRPERVPRRPAAGRRAGPDRDPPDRDDAQSPHHRAVHPGPRSALAKT